MRKREDSRQLETRSRVPGQRTGPFGLCGRAARTGAPGAQGKEGQGSGGFQSRRHLTPDLHPDPTVRFIGCFRCADMEMLLNEAPYLEVGVSSLRCPWTLPVDQTGHQCRVWLEGILLRIRPPHSESMELVVRQGPIYLHYNPIKLRQY